jgi:hypothetical protein
MSPLNQSKSRMKKKMFFFSSKTKRLLFLLRGIRAVEVFEYTKKGLHFA